MRLLNTKDFEKINKEFIIYKRKAKKHCKEFEETKSAWSKLLNNMN